MKTLLTLFLALVVTLPAVAAELFVWQASDGALPLILARGKNDRPADVVREYVRSFNADRELVSLEEEKLHMELEGFREMPPVGSKPRFLVLANEPAQFRGAGNSKTWYRDLTKFGAEVFVLPTAADVGMSPSRAREFRKLLVANFDAVLALGGADIDPEVYGEKNRHSKNMNTARDISEKAFLAEFIESHEGKKPVACFGICRGAQHFSRAMGYSLIQDIRAETDNKHDHRAEDHMIRLKGAKDSIFFKEFGNTNARVNSIHHQAVDSASNPKGGLEVVGMHVPAGADPIAEILEFKNGYGFLVQFHPERMTSPFGRRVMKLMVTVAEDIQQVRLAGKSCRRILSP